MTYPDHRALEAERQHMANVAAKYAGQPAQPAGLTAEEQATLLDIVRQYRAYVATSNSGVASPQVAMAWVYGLVANSALNDGSL